MITKEREELRRVGVGGSEISAICGIDPYKAAIDVFLDKTKGRDYSSMSPQAVLGTECGPALIRAYMKLYNKKVFFFGDDELTFRNKTYPICYATPDGIEDSAPDAEAVLKNGSGVLIETKFPSANTRHHWSKDGPAMHVIPQVTWQMGASGRTEARIVAHLGDPGLSVYDVHFDADLFATLLERAESFMELVRKGIPPPPDGSDSYTKHLNATIKKRKDSVMVSPDNAMVELAKAYKTACVHFDASERRLKALQQSIKEKIGEHDGYEVEGFCRFTWKEHDGRKVVDWEAVSRELAGDKDIDGIVRKNTKKGVPYRTFLSNFTGGKGK